MHIINCILDIFQRRSINSEGASTASSTSSAQQIDVIASDFECNVANLIYNVHQSLNLTNFSTASGESLLCKEPELPEFMNEVAKQIPTKWKQLGVQLRLDVNDLEKIDADLLYEPSMNRSEAAFIKLFTIWKKVRPSAFAWATLITALRTRALDEQTLAQELYAKLCSWYA